VRSRITDRLRRGFVDSDVSSHLHVSDSLNQREVGWDSGDHFMAVRIVLARLDRSRDARQPFIADPLLD
jgi:hypothetical protein